MHDPGRLGVESRRANQKFAGPVEQNDFRLAFELRGIEPVFFKLLQERPRSTPSDKTFALAWLRTLSENALPAPIGAALGIEKMDIHLMMGDASPWRILHERYPALHRALQCLETRQVGGPDRQIQDRRTRAGSRYGGGETHGTVEPPFLTAGQPPRTQPPSGPPAIRSWRSRSTARPSGTGTGGEGGECSGRRCPHPIVVPTCSQRCHHHLHPRRTGLP